MTSLGAFFFFFFLSSFFFVLISVSSLLFLRQTGQASFSLSLRRVSVWVTGMGQRIWLWFRIAKSKTGNAIITLPHDDPPAQYERCLGGSSQVWLNQRAVGLGTDGKDQGRRYSLDGPQRHERAPGKGRKVSAETQPMVVFT
ncbi:hypothetical protein LZ31DRAFT_338169 [Colletotrichum somersetense]|nr:hypothetical protein LZ31DRAFT_338169 [Colletotrichum somersetense]